MQNNSLVRLANFRMLQFAATKLGVVLDGRLEIVDEIAQADSELCNYLIKSFVGIDNSKAFHGAILGHFVQYGGLAESRARMLEEKIKTIIEE